MISQTQMKISKIILFVFSFFIFGFLSASAASITGTVTVQVVGAGLAVVDCSGSYSACINGSQTYNITAQAENGGAVCPAVDGATQNCGTSCIGNWSSCSNGSQTYNITTPASGGGAVCPSSDNATRTCGTSCIGNWSSCSDASQTYNVTTPASGGGAVCPFLDNATRVCGTTCSSPLTKNVSLSCPVNANGDAAISGSVIQKQTKSAFPGCIFETSVTNLNSTYVSDNCKYPKGPMYGTLNATSCLIGIGNNSCSVSYSWSVTNADSSSNTAVTLSSMGINPIAIGDSGSKSFTLPYGSDNVWLYNSDSASPLGASPITVTAICDPATSSWGGSSCTALPPSGPVPPSGPTGPTGPVVDGYWTAWSPISVCPAGGTQTRSCILPQNGGASCPNDGLGTSRSILSSSCPSLDIWFTWKGKKLLPTEKIVYNGIANVLWTSENVDSCSCDYSDSTVTNRSCGGNQNSPYVTPALKRDTAYTISCLGSFGSISKSVTIPVDKINPNYIEQ